MKSEELEKLLFTLNPDAFEEVRQRMEGKRENEMKRFLADFPTTAH